MTDHLNTQSGVVNISHVSLYYGQTHALDDVNLSIPSGCMVGMIGPDGVGKSSLLSLIAGARAVQEGAVDVLKGDMRLKEHRNRVCPLIAYMPQGLGKNLYPTLSVEENLQFFARLFGHDAAERRKRIDNLTKSTGLHHFLSRPAGKLSGGMKQKLGLCCALIHDPDLLILDEPTTGVDPLARSQFWDLISHIRTERSKMSVIVATAYMDEAERFDWLIAMDDGKILTTGKPSKLLIDTDSETLEDAFIKLLPEEKRSGYEPVIVPPLAKQTNPEVAIEAQDLTMQFGDFVAVDKVNLRITQGEIFGFLGSNGCGKSTTMKMLTGLLPATGGKAWLFGREVDSNDINIRRRVGYMSQAFSLYSELTVHQNLVLHARLFHVPEEEIDGRVNEMIKRFDLADVTDSLPDNLPLGMRQRLSLCVAMVHKPELLILDEPTSGVDPIARDNFWRFLIDLSRNDHVTIFITTHFMTEAERCDRISLMHAGKILDSDKPQALVKKKNAQSLEEAFIAYLVEAGAGGEDTVKEETDTMTIAPASEVNKKERKEYLKGFSVQRMISYMWREALELRRDPVRATLALVGSLLLMFVMGFGISLDVEDLSYAVLDRDQTLLSENYNLNLSGSRYFVEKAPIKDYAQLDERMRSGDISLAIEIPPDFAQKIQKGTPVAIGAWVDGAMPQRAETIRGYVLGMHQGWLITQAKEKYGVTVTSPFSIETRFRYNPDVKSLPSIVPAVIPILLLMFPAMLTALAVVREKELGSIINLYVTPVTRSEFLLGKQIPYIALAMFNYLLMVLFAITVFGVQVKGSFLSLTLAVLIFCITSTGIGLLASTFTRSQIAAMFFTIIGTLIPAIQFAGMINPVPSLEGGGRFIGEIYPASHMLTISRGVFSKALALPDLYSSFGAMLLAVPVIMMLSIFLLKKQDS